jgi:hypothetical protein
VEVSCQLVTRSLYARGKDPRYQQDRRLGSPPELVTRFEKEITFLLLPGIEPRGPDPNVFITVTEPASILTVFTVLSPLTSNLCWFSQCNIKLIERCTVFVCPVFCILFWNRLRIDWCRLHSLSGLLVCLTVPTYLILSKRILTLTYKDSWLQYFNTTGFKDVILSDNLNYSSIAPYTLKIKILVPRC